MPVHEKLKNDLLSSTIIALYRGVLTLIALLKQLLRSWICKAVITSQELLSNRGHQIFLIQSRFVMMTMSKRKRKTKRKRSKRKRKIRL